MFKRPGGGGSANGAGLPLSNGSDGSRNGSSNGGAATSSTSTSAAPPPRKPKRKMRSGPIGTPLYGHPYSSNANPSGSGDFRPATTACTSFLLGGQYGTAGRGKARSQSSRQFLLRRRSLAYRIFCSSPPRMCGTTVFVLYLVVAFAVMPLLGLLMGLGRSLAGAGGGHIRATVINKKGPNAIPPAPDLDGRNYPSLAGMKLRSIHDANEEATKLHKVMKNARQTTGNKVGDALADTLEDLVPEWLHRNDPPAAEETKKMNAGGNAATKTVTVMKDDEERRIPAGNNHDGGDNAGFDEHDENDFVGNPEEGIDAVDIDDDIDEARGDDAVQELPPQKSNAETAAKDVNSPVQRDQKTTGDKALQPETNQRADGERQQQRQRQQRTLQNMVDLPLSSSCPIDLAPDSLSTTLVTQCTLNRVDLLLETCNRWKGPIILSLFLANDEEESAWSDRQSNWEDMCPQMTTLAHRATAEEHEAGSYPVNKLRNIGLDAVRTSHVFVMDADFVPSADLHGTIGDVLSARHQMEQMEGGDGGIGQRDAIIVPAFERKPPEPCSSIEDCRKYIKEDSTFIPQTIEDLRDCGRGSKKDCIVFQSDNNWEGHHTTHSDQWLKGDWYDDGDYREAEPDLNATGDGNAGNVEKKKRRKEKMDLSRKIKTVKCFDSLRYEPWVVLRWCPSVPKAGAGTEDHSRPVAPYFDERFHGYGKNKIEIISHLRFLGYTFSILPMSFIIHQPHPESEHKAVWKDVQNEDLHYDMDELYPKFLRELARKYDGGKNAVPTCKKQKQAKKKEAGVRDGEPKTDNAPAVPAVPAAAATNIEKKNPPPPPAEEEKDHQQGGEEVKKDKIKKKAERIDIEKDDN